MRDLLERLQWFSAHALTGGVRRYKIRELSLQIEQLPVKPIVFAIADYWGSFIVIETVVLPDLISQLLETLCSWLLVHCHFARYEQTKFSAKVERLVRNALLLSSGKPMHHLIFRKNS
jgi:hypothetical protein